MASQSPTGVEPVPEYRLGWANLTRLMDAGASWSGRERNCAFLNLGGRRFVDVSAAPGLGFIEDGRAVAAGDWDGDGDVDLWLKNRTGPQLRLMVNRTDGRSDFVGFRLRGTTSNTDAIGARVTVTAGGREYVREVRAGEGYLAQSSSELTFGLGDVAVIDRVDVRWPGGPVERFVNLQPGVRYRLVEGTGEATPLEKRTVQLDAPTTPWPAAPAASRIVLRTPLPVPPELLQELSSRRQDHRGALLLTLWASWCAPCVTELIELAEHGDELDAVGLEVIPVAVDTLEAPGRSHALFEEKVAPRSTGPGFASREPTVTQRETLEVLLDHLIPGQRSTSLPVSLLVDRNGMIEVLYLGPVSAGTLLEDAHAFGMNPEKVAVRSTRPGRWFYGMPRNFAGLRDDFRARGLTAGATYYAALYGMLNRGRR